MPPAARVGDDHKCLLLDASGNPHEGGPILPAGSVATVLIDGKPAAVMGTMCKCNSIPDALVFGSGTVLIGGLQAARMGDTTAHGGKITGGCSTVLIGD